MESSTIVTKCRCRESSVQVRHGVQRLHKMYPYHYLSFYCIVLLTTAIFHIVAVTIWSAIPPSLYRFVENTFILVYAYMLSVTSDLHTLRYHGMHILARYQNILICF